MMMIWLFEVESRCIGASLTNAKIKNMDIHKVCTSRNGFCMRVIFCLELLC